MKDIGWEKFLQLQKKGYTLDLIYVLLNIDKVDLEEVKVASYYQTLLRKQLITSENKLTLEGKSIIDFLSLPEEAKLERRKPDNDGFDRWWKTYPGTDSFEIGNRKFVGTRALRAKKDDCKAKINKILGEGEYTIDDLIKALELEISQKKQNSLKTGQNKLSYMQNSLTYLNQCSYEPFIELVKAGHKTEETKPISGGVEI